MLAAISLAATALCLADPLWNRRSPYQTYLYQDTKARRPGDLVTIVINENTDVDNSDSRNLNKTNNTGFKLDFNGAAGGDIGSQSGTATIDANQSSNRSMNGNTSYSSDRDFSDRVTVSVLQVMPNGNLIIGGSRRILVEGDERILTLRGIVRALDINPDNTVPSRLIADLHVFYEGNGPESRFVNQGWFSRCFNKVWPF